MKVAAFLSVAATFVAAQPSYFAPVPPPQKQGPCTYAKGYNAQCCVSTAYHPLGCAATPGMRVPPMGFYGRPPPPPPMFVLGQICCAAGEQCCIADTSNLFQPSYTCCGAGTKCNTTTGEGVCEDVESYNEAFPYQYNLDNYGRCPEDGGLPLQVRPGQPFRCTMNVAIAEATNSLCPTGSYCAKDLTANQDEGVCCYDTKCGLHTNCTSCTTPSTTAGVPSCSWLSQGYELDATPMCVRSCTDFPQKSCILPHANGNQCPRAPWNPDGTNYNVGNCQRRCGNVGTGRSSGINVMGNFPNFYNSGSWTGGDGYTAMDDEAAFNAFENGTICCQDLPGDFCCDDYYQLAQHCQLGRVPGGPACGVPISGTPNTFFNTAPYQTPPSVDAYVATHMPIRPPMPPPPPMYYNGGMGFGMPMGFGGMYSGFGGMYSGFGAGFGFSPFTMNAMYRQYGQHSSEEELSKAVSTESDKQFFYPNAGFNMFRPMAPVPPRVPPPPLVDQQPSAFICSCDSMCADKVNSDCCDDYWIRCDTTVNSTGPPAWWVSLPEAFYPGN